MTILKFENISKTFSGTVALNNINLEVKKGEVHAICGENGAGKSTLIKILAGVHKPDPGACKMIIEGEEITTFTPIYSKSKGIAVIYQELDLIPYLTAVENIVLGNEPRVKGRLFIDKRKSIKIATNLFERINVKVPLFVPVKNLSIAQQQMIMIARAISYDAKILVMDEPTAALVDKDVENLFRIVKDLKKAGITIIYISHRIEEIFRIADRVTVLRDGQKVITLDPQGIEKSDLIRYMIGREIIEDVHGRIPPNKDVKVLEVINISTNSKIENVSFDLYEGEILGIAGLVGSGRTELARAIFGIDKLTDGKIKLYGKVIKPNPCQSIKYELGYIPEDRKTQGLFLNLPILENVTIPTINNLFASQGFLKKRKEIQSVVEIVKRVDIRPTNYKMQVKSLSGGNQQKVVLAKWLLPKSKVLIIDEPTRGIDVGAKEEIYNLMYNLKEKGHSIIMISSELPEVIRVSDRVAVMANGKIKGFVSGKDLSEEKIMRLAI
jgi:ribose transport system ATP-binding protein